MSATQIAEVARQTALVLAASHEDGAVHRALDPGRIFLVIDPNLPGGTRVKVTGFGAATLAGDRARTHAYRAPEQWRDFESTDPQIDIYALGCIAFEMACGRAPFAGASADELRAKHESHAPPNARALMPDVPPDLEKLLARLIAKEPAKRPRSMRETARALDVIGGGTAPLAPTHQGTPALAAGIIENTAKLTPPAAGDLPALPPAKTRRRGWIPIAIVAAILVVGGGIALIAALRSSSEPAAPRDTVKR
jgi:serine/threonine protein kinase